MEGGRGERKGEGETDQMEGGRQGGKEGIKPVGRTKEHH